MSSLEMLAREQITGEELPNIVTKPPGPISRSLAKELIQYESKGVSSIAIGKIPIAWAKAKGANFVDVDGNTYIELTSGFGVAVIGHTNARVVAAIKEQADDLIHGQGGINPNVPRVELAKKLAEVTPGNLTKCIILITGGEAVELATKTARLFTGKAGIIAFHGGYHGKTYGALSFTSRNFYRQPFMSFFSGSHHVPYPYCYRCPFKKIALECESECISYLEYVLDEPCSGLGEIAAIILEPIQGHEGVIIPPNHFLPEIRRICDGRGILMITDEIITGFGRTGEWFAVDHCDVVPDLMAVGKGMASGFPVSALIGKADIMDAWATTTGESTHSSTFMANPLGCAASLASIAELEERGLVDRGARIGSLMLQGFQELSLKHPIIGDVRGQGMYIGVEIVKDRDSKEPAHGLAGKVVAEAMGMGVLVNPGGRFGHILKFSPPLVLTEEQLSFVLEAYDKAFGIVEKSM